MSEKIIRDPVHDVIAFRLDHPSDSLLFRLIGAAEVQRLRRIRQLGMASLAYPGADHSRYSHSLGVMQTARQMLEQFARSFYIPQDRQLVCLAAALLHDLGHGPFSHVFERVSGVHHEALTQSLVLDPESEVNQILASHDRAMPQLVADMMKGKPKRDYFTDTLSSQLDADRLDYLLRDNLMTGSQYGGYDLSWLLQAMTIDESTQRIVVSWKGVSAVEAYLQSRYHMYRNVYFHKVVRSAEGMLKLALNRARRMLVQDRLDWPRRDHPVCRALLGQQLTTAEFVDLDDVSVMHCFKVWSDGADAMLASLCRGLLFRKVFKTIELSRVDGAEHAKAMVTAASQAISDAGGDPNYDMFYDEPSDTPYKTYQPDQQEASSEIRVRTPEGILQEFASISPLPNALNRVLMFRRLHVAPQYRDLAAATVEAMR